MPTASTSTASRDSIRWALLDLFAHRDHPGPAVLQEHATMLARLPRPEATGLWDDLVEKRTLYPWSGDGLAELARGWSEAAPCRARTTLNDPDFARILGRVCIKGLLPLLNAFFDAGAPLGTSHTMHPPSLHTATQPTKDAGWTLLHLAAWRADLPMVDHLLNRGADPLGRSEGGVTPLHTVLMQRHEQSLATVARLLDAGAIASVEQRAPVLMGRTPLDIARDAMTTEVWGVALQRWEQAQLHRTLGASPDAAGAKETPRGPTTVPPVASPGRPRL